MSTKPSNQPDGSPCNNISSGPSNQGNHRSFSEFQDDFFGMMSIADHEEAISDAAFSPDGTALATASLDGQG